MKKVLINAYTLYNLGDDLFIKILVEKYPSTEFSLIAPKKYNEFVNNYSNLSLAKSFRTTLLAKIFLKLYSFFDSEIEFKSLFSIIKKNMKDHDCYVYIGGSLFGQHSQNISTYDKVNKWVGQIFPNKPKFIIGANFGPVSSQNFIDFYREEVFKNYTDVCFRDSRSKEYFPNLENVRWESDVVFQLKGYNHEKEPQTVGLSLIDISKKYLLHQYKESFVSFIARIISSYLENDKKVFLFSFCKDLGDESVMVEVLNLLSEKDRLKVTSVYYRNNMEEFLNQYSRMEIMYCTRFHALILSIICEQEVFPIIYDEKQINALNDMFVQPFYIPISEMETIDYKNIMESSISEKPNIDKLIQSSSKQFSGLNNFISQTGN